MNNKNSSETTFEWIIFCTAGVGLFPTFYQLCEWVSLIIQNFKAFWHNLSSLLLITTKTPKRCRFFRNTFNRPKSFRSQHRICEILITIFLPGNPPYFSIKFNNLWNSRNPPHLKYQVRIHRFSRFFPRQRRGRGCRNEIFIDKSFRNIVLAPSWRVDVFCVCAQACDVFLCHYHKSKSIPLLQLIAIGVAFFRHRQLR